VSESKRPFGSSLRSLIVDLVCVVATISAIVYFRPGLFQKFTGFLEKAHLVNTPSPPAQLTPSAQAAQPTQPVQRSAAAQPNDNPDCATKEEVGGLDLDKTVSVQLIKTGEALARKARPLCVHVGKAYTVEYHFGVPTRVLIIATDAKVRVEAIQDDHQDGKNKYLLRLKLVEGYPLSDSRWPSINIRSANVIYKPSKTQLNQALQQGATWIDVRPPAEFARKHDPRAINIPYFFGRSNRDWKALLQVFKTVDHFDLSKLPQDKTRPLLFSGLDWFDVAPLRALLLAQAAGWKQLTWFRPGELALESRSPFTPDQVNGIERLEPNQLVKLQAVFVWTAAGESPIRNAIPLAKWEKTLRTATNKSVPVLFFGVDKFDFSPIQAAQQAVNAGWKKVYWFREGSMGWSRYLGMQRTKAAN
jgi:rhodanese-related sulfurtransferase